MIVPAHIHAEHVIAHGIRAIIDIVNVPGYVHLVHPWAAYELLILAPVSLIHIPYLHAARADVIIPAGNIQRRKVNFVLIYQEISPVPVTVIIFVLHPLVPKRIFISSGHKGYIPYRAVLKHLIPVIPYTVFWSKILVSHRGNPRHGSRGQNTRPVRKIEQRNTAGDHAYTGFEVGVSAGRRLPLDD